MEDCKTDNLEEALNIIDVTYQANADRIALPPPPIADWPPFGALVPLCIPEREQLFSLCNLIVQYVRQRQHDHPLCLGVFGPPGSGKSFAAKEIQTQAIKRLKQFGQDHRQLAEKMTTINLTQVGDASELANAVAAAVQSANRDSDPVPVLFFDEFDASHQGARYGWLSWFLAPMHDGEFLRNGVRVNVKEAILVFAGGTAETMVAFTDRQSDVAFREAKGPDFVSRLRGYLNVLGPNGDPRYIRRAIILRSALQRRIDQQGTGSFTFDQELLRSLLYVGRYRHGARSISALIELAKLDTLDTLVDQEKLDATCKHITWHMLPEEHLLALQVDRGPLDGDAIEGSIALSGSVDEESETRAKGIRACWTEVARRLWAEGATLAYAGRLEDTTHSNAGTSDDLMLAWALVHYLNGRPPEPSADSNHRIKPRARFRSFLKGLEPQKPFKTESEPKERLHEREAEARRRPTDFLHKQGIAHPEECGIEFVVRTYLEYDELRYVAWQQKVIEWFRRRLAVSQDSVARFVIGGHATTKPATYRISGLVEEVVLSLALRKPVYLAGGFGGGVTDIGNLLGLASYRTEASSEFKEKRLTELHPELLKEIRGRLQLPQPIDLPFTPLEHLAFFREHALGGQKWPYNGLTEEQNRQLFRSTDATVVGDLVVCGLLKVFAKASSGGASI
jgi:hypothetical protein